MTAGARVIVRSRAARGVALVWFVAGLLLVVSAVLLVVSQRRVSFDLPLGLVALVVGVWIWRRRVEFDDDGVVVVAGRRSRRLFWSRIAGVGVVAGPWWRTAVGLEFDEGSVALPPTWGVSRSTREALHRELTDLVVDHDVPVHWHE